MSNQVNEDRRDDHAQYEEAEKFIVPMFRGPEQGWQVKAIRHLNDRARPIQFAGKAINQSSWSRALAGEKVWSLMVDLLVEFEHDLQRNPRKYVHPGPIGEGFLGWLKGYASSQWWREVLQTDETMSFSTFRSVLSGQPTKQISFLRGKAEEWLERLDRGIEEHLRVTREIDFMRATLLALGGDPRWRNKGFQTRMRDFIARGVTRGSSLEDLLAAARELGDIRAEARRLVEIAFAARSDGFDPRTPGPRISKSTWISEQQIAEEAEALLQEALLTTFEHAVRDEPVKGQVYEEVVEREVNWYSSQAFLEYWPRRIRVLVRYTWNDVERKYEEDEVGIIEIEGQNRTFRPLKQTDYPLGLFTADDAFHIARVKGCEPVFSPGQAVRMEWG